MPYITQHRRDELEFGTIGMVRPENPGELNYCLTKIMVNYMGEGPRYSDVNEIIGAVECAKQELYRRVAVPIEEIACATRGDVYYDEEG